MPVFLCTRDAVCFRLGRHVWLGLFFDAVSLDMAALAPTVAAPLSRGAEKSACCGEFNSLNGGGSGCGGLSGGVGLSAVGSGRPWNRAENSEGVVGVDGGQEAVAEGDTGGSSLCPTAVSLKEKNQSDFRRDLRRALLVLGMLEIKAENEAAAAACRPLFSFENVEALNARRLSADAFWGGTLSRPSPSQGSPSAGGGTAVAKSASISSSGASLWTPRQRQNEALRRHLLRQRSEQGQLLAWMQMQEAKLLTEQKERRRFLPPNPQAESCSFESSQEKSLSPGGAALQEGLQVPSLPWARAVADSRAVFEKKPLSAQASFNELLAATGRRCGDDVFSRGLRLNALNAAALASHPAAGAGAPAYRSAMKAPPTRRPYELSLFERQPRMGDFAERFGGAPPHAGLLSQRSDWRANAGLVQLPPLVGGEASFAARQNAQQQTFQAGASPHPWKEGSLVGFGSRAAHPGLRPQQGWSDERSLREVASWQALLEEAHPRSAPQNQTTLPLHRLPSSSAFRGGVFESPACEEKPFLYLGGGGTSASASGTAACLQLEASSLGFSPRGVPSPSQQQASPPRGEEFWTEEERPLMTAQMQVREASATRATVVPSLNAATNWGELFMERGGLYTRPF